MMVPPRPRVSDLHAHLVCVLCGGYYVDATTIVECFHSFCRSCIVRYLESSKFCPMCDVQVHKTKPLLNLRSDKTLQSLVYKMVPGVYSAEMKRRREYYDKLREKGGEVAGCASTSPEDRGEPETPEIFSSDDSISLSLEYYTGETEDAEKSQQGDEKQTDAKKETRQVTHKRYLQCPAAVCMRHLKKFIRLKYGLSPDYKVDIIYENECLREEFTLMDVAYTFDWKRNSSLRFSYRIYERPRITHSVGVTATDRKISDSGEEPPVKRPRLLSSDAPSSGSQHPVSSSTSQSKPQDTEVTPATESTETVHSTPSAHEKLRSRSEIKTVTPKPTPPPTRPKTPKEKKEARSNSSDSKRDSTSKSSVQPPKTISQPPKPIMPGQKPPSQTALMLQQRIMQQRQQHQKMQLQKQQQQLQKQQQQKQFQLQKQIHSLQQKQIPSLQKLHSIPRTTPTVKLNTPSPLPSTFHNKPSVSSATQATSKPASLQTPSSSKPPAPSKPVLNSVPRPSPSQTPANKPPQQVVNKPPPPTPINPPKPSPNAEIRRDDSNLIDKNKMRPVVVIERHAKKPDKSPAPVEKPRDKSPKVSNKTKASAASSLTVAPGSSVTKLKLVKRAAGSPASSPPVAKKVASETPKPAPPLAPLEIRAPGDPPRHDDIGALDLSGKSSRKSDSPCSSHSSGAPSPPAPSPTEPPPKPPQQPRTNMASSKQSKNQNPQTSIMSIAQTLVNRQLSNLAFNGDGSRSPNSPHSQGSSSPSSQGSGSGQNFRNLMTLSDTAVHLLSAQQRGPVPQPRMRLPSPAQQTNSGVKPNYGRGPTSQSSNLKSPPAAPSNSPVTIRIPSVPSLNKNSSPPPRTIENGSLLSPNRIPRINDLFPGPQSKPGQNQGLRHIPNPSLLGFRQQANRLQHQQSRKDEITITPTAPPPLSSIRKIENLTRNIGEGKVTATGLGAGAVRVGDSSQ